MTERIAQLSDDKRKPTDTLIKIMDKRHYTRERLTEVKVEIQNSRQRRND